MTCPCDCHDNDTGSSRRWDGEPETPADKRFFDLGESGYEGWIDEDGYPAACPSCGQSDCTKSLTEHWQEKNNNGGPAMTASTHTCGEFTTIPQLQQEYELMRQNAAESVDELTAYANKMNDEAVKFTATADVLDSLAAEWDSKAGQLQSAGHDTDTCADAAATAEALRALALASRENAERCVGLAEQATHTVTAAEAVETAAERGATDIQNNLSGLMEQASSVQAKAPLNHYASQ